MIGRVRIGNAIVAGVALVAITAIGATRGLNFDETLALRSGWLYVSGAETRPAFLMPVVYMMGVFASWFEDPGVVLVGLRVAVAVSVVGVLAWSATKTLRTTGDRAAWLALCFANGAFLTHAIEFRYDWAILVAWVAAWTVMSEPGRSRPVILGALFGWLALHHLKGLFYAVALYPVALYALTSVSGYVRSDIIRFHGAAIAVAAAWLAIVLSIGRGTDLVEFYVGFLQLGLSTEVDARWSRLLGRIDSDIVWWSMTAGAILVMTFMKGSIPRPARFGIFFMLVPVMFAVVHPLPWPYLLAPVVPFAAFFMVTATASMFAARPASRAGLVLAVVLLVTLAAFRELVPQYRETTMAEVVQTLRHLRTLAGADDHVIDPSGVVYFLAPAGPEWYTDTLFRTQPGWQAETADSAANADWALSTYRLAWLPPTAQAKIAEDFNAFCGPLRAHREFAAESGAGPCPLESHAITSVW